MEQQTWDMDFLRPEVQQEYQDCIMVLVEKLRQFAEQQQAELHRELVSQIAWRLKSEQSILAKLRRKKREKTNDNIYRYINDLAGIRVVCLYLDDVDRVRVFLEKPAGHPCFEDQRLYQKAEEQRISESAYAGTVSQYAQGGNPNPHDGHGLLVGDGARITV